ncbi:MAG: BCD family MFS transporter [Steroidobacteraceae bacterium]|jgi:BCD family chlorophyll transporter-like MFS transporter|nr:BCD family MFS transporter [Steroidobacteraceae bacterium]
MSRRAPSLALAWTRLGPRLLPFADAATRELPLGRLLRLSLFQVSVGLATVLLSGTLNRVMILELGVPAWLVALMVSLPLVFAPARALIGFRSDTHRSVLGWRRVPYIWAGTLLQFGGLAIMPFALLLLSGDTHWPSWFGTLSAALAFLLVGAGLHTTQTAGLALAADLAPQASRPRVVALLYVMLLVGMVASALVFGLLLQDFSQMRLIQVIQGAAMITMALNLLALWKQEARDSGRAAAGRDQPSFGEAWTAFAGDGRATRFLVAVGLGTAAFSMQDILLEPYGGEILGLAVGQTTMLTAFVATGALVAFAIAAHRLARGSDPLRLAAVGALAGVAAFSAVIFAASLQSPQLFRLGTALIGLGGGLFSVCMLTAAMGLDRVGRHGLALGAWGAVHATATGAGIALGGGLRDLVDGLAMNGSLGSVLAVPTTGYAFVYHIEIGLLFATVVALGPLVGRARRLQQRQAPFGLAEFPG